MTVLTNCSKRERACLCAGVVRGYPVQALLSYPGRSPEPRLDIAIQLAFLHLYIPETSTQITSNETNVRMFLFFVCLFVCSSPGARTEATYRSRRHCWSLNFHLPSSPGRCFHYRTRSSRRCWPPVRGRDLASCPPSSSPPPPPPRSCRTWAPWAQRRDRRWEGRSSPTWTPSLPSRATTAKL